MIAGLIDVSPAEFDDSQMGADGIHPTDAGYSRIADAIVRMLAPSLSQRATAGARGGT
jgi:lysophospholipase L1-like esterase